MNKYLSIAAAVALAISLSGCPAIPFQDNHDEGTVSVAFTGSLVPNLELYHTQVLGTPFDPQGFAGTARALFGASRAELTVKDAGATTVATETLDFTGADSGPGMYEGHFVLAPGTGYTIESQVFNDAVSAVTPVVIGTSDSFDVVAGESVAVYLFHIPYAPEPKAVGDAWNLAGVPTTIDLDTYDVLIGQEFWYEFQATSDTTIVRGFPSTTDAYSTSLWITVSDSTGMPQQTGMSAGYASGGSDGPIETQIETTVGETYYVGVAAISTAGDADFNASISVQAGSPQPASEPNNTQADAEALSAATIVERATDDPYSMTAPEPGDVYYFDFDSASGSAVKVSFEILNPGAGEFEGYVHVNDSTFAKMGDSLYVNSTVWGSQYLRPLETGRYYLHVTQESPLYPADGYRYALKWEYTDEVTDDSYEPNDDFASAATLAQGVTADGWVWNDDYFTLDLAAGATVTIDFSCTPVDGQGVYIDLYDSLENHINGYYCSDTPVQMVEYLAAGTYYLAVPLNYGSDGIAYSLVWN